MKYLPLLLSAFLMIACASNPQAQGDIQASSYTVEPAKLSPKEKENLAVATFAGGCFWCTEAVFEQVKGVKSVVSGYAGGSKANPTYKEVAAGKTDYAESIQIYFDEEEISFQELLEIFFGTHDPTQLNRQGPDVGKQYRSEVFYHSDKQKQEVEQYIQKLSASGKYDDPIVTQVSAFEKFYNAEDYHQNYYEHNPDNPYIINVAEPKISKFKKNYSQYLKDDIKS